MMTLAWLITPWLHNSVGFHWRWVWCSWITCEVSSLMHKVKIPNVIHCCSISFEPGQRLLRLVSTQIKVRVCFLSTWQVWGHVTSRPDIFWSALTARRINKSGDARKTARSHPRLQGFITKICISTRSNLNAFETRSNTLCQFWARGRTWVSVVFVPETKGLKVMSWQLLRLDEAPPEAPMRRAAVFSQVVESPLIVSRQSILTFKVVWVSR